jgi:hypothetical protein
MQTDVLCSASFTATGNILTADATASVASCRIKQVSYSASVAGTLVFRDGSATGPIRMTVPIGIATFGFLLPGEGVLFRGTPHCTVVGATLAGAVVFYA